MGGKIGIFIYTILSLLFSIEFFTIKMTHFRQIYLNKYDHGYFFAFIDFLSGPFVLLLLIFHFLIMNIHFRTLSFFIFLRILNMEQIRILLRDIK